MRRIALILLVLLAGTLAAEDSPLVAAAKSRKNAKVKSKIMITNETLSKEGGHISTTASQPAINLPKADPNSSLKPPAKPEPKVRTIGTAQNAVRNLLAQPVPDALRYSEGSDLEQDLDVMAEDVQPATLSPRMQQSLTEPQTTQKPVAPQSTNKPIEAQQSQKPPL